VLSRSSVSHILRGLDPRLTLQNYPIRPGFGPTVPPRRGRDAFALRQPDETPAVEVGSHLEVLVLIEEPEEDGSSSK